MPFANWCGPNGNHRAYHRTRTDGIPRVPQRIEAALLALEAEGFVLRGKFIPARRKREWCDGGCWRAFTV